MNSKFLFIKKMFGFMTIKYKEPNHYYHKINIEIVYFIDAKNKSYNSIRIR